MNNTGKIIFYGIVYLFLFGINAIFTTDYYLKQEYIPAFITFVLMVISGLASIGCLTALMEDDNERSN